MLYPLQDLLWSFKARNSNLLSSIIGASLTIVEFGCYIISFSHIFHHDNYIAVTVLNQTIIKNRNRTNAVSLVGLFISWLLQVVYVVISGFVATMLDHVWLREYTSLLRIVEFAFIPWIQIHTSPPLKQFRLKISQKP